MSTPTQILCTGPEPYTDRAGDEHPEWTVCAADDDREPVGRVYRVRKSLDLARRLAVRMAVDRRLSLSGQDLFEHLRSLAPHPLRQPHIP